MTTTTLCFAILACLVIGVLLGLNFFLLPFYLLSGRTMTLKRAMTNCARGEGLIVFVRGAGYFDRIWWIRKLPSATFRLRLQGTIVLSFRSEPSLRQIIPNLETRTARIIGFVDPVSLDDHKV